MIRQLKQLFRRLQIADRMVAAPVAPDWTELDKQHWAAFIGSDTGKRLWARLRAVEHDVMARACKETFQPGHAARHAGGFADCRVYLESLSRVSCAVETNDIESAEGEPRLDELLAP